MMHGIIIGPSRRSIYVLVAVSFALNSCSHKTSANALPTRTPVIKGSETLKMSGDSFSRIIKSRVPAQEVKKFRAAPIMEVFHQRIPNIKKREAAELADLFLHLCLKYGFNPALMLGLIKVESGFNPVIESDAGAVGLMQILPTTAEPIARYLSLPWRGKKSLRNPKINLQIGFFYLDYLRSIFGIRHKYVTAYNWGPARVENMLLERRRLPLEYFRKIEASKKEYAGLDHLVGL